MTAIAFPVLAMKNSPRAVKSASIESMLAEAEQLASASEAVAARITQDQAALKIADDKLELVIGNLKDMAQGFGGDLPSALENLGGYLAEARAKLEETAAFPLVF